MNRVAIVYFSVTQNTHLLAQAVASGIRSVEGAEAELIRITGSDITEGRYRNEATFSLLEDSQAIVLGSPTYMGSASAQMKAFMDASSELWASHGWRDKVAGGFTTGASPSGDKLFTLQQFAIFAAQHGMHWVTMGDLPSEDELNRMGSGLGAMGHSPSFEEARSLHPGDEQTAFHYGRRIAEVTGAMAAIQKPRREDV